MSVMIVIVILSVVYKTYISTTNVSLGIQQEKMVEKVDMDFYVINATNNNPEGEVLIYLENTGSKKIDLQYLDFFIDSKRILRDDSIRVIELVSSTNLVNENLWDPNEIVKVNISETLSLENHLIRVSSENGITRSAIMGA